MIVQNNEEIFFLTLSSLLVGKTLGEVTNHIRPGITLKKLDNIAEEFIRANGGQPAFKGYRGYPATLCISVNDVVVHGIPILNEIKEGDLVSIDCGVKMNGMFGDFAYSFIVGEVKEEIHKFVNATKDSLNIGIKQAMDGKTTGDVGNAVQTYIEKLGYSVVRELVGHGIGKVLHDKPELPNFGKKGKGTLLQKGMVLCVEPMINMGRKDVYLTSDGWSIKTKDGKPSAHFEHMIIVEADEPRVLSTFEFIENNIKKNIWLNNRL